MKINNEFLELISNVGAFYELDGKSLDDEDLQYVINHFHLKNPKLKKDEVFWKTLLEEDYVLFGGKGCLNLMNKKHITNGTKVHVTKIDKRLIHEYENIVYQKRMDRLLKKFENKIKQNENI